MNKRKVFNDPIHGFIKIPFDIIYDIIEHPYFQRLRRIKQLGLTDYVYPGALHTRFHHALGAFHLMQKAVFTLRQKNIEITIAEEEAVLIAILLHDVGHAPFSHTLEHYILEDVSHEFVSLLYMKKFNALYNGKLDLAIQIFQNQYHKKFLYQLISSQLDVDRLDYLTRDSFFTGVSEGIINYNRILDMISVKDDELVLEAKGIYSIEKFLISRRIMYWQVYLHKTVISAEEMLIQILLRAKELVADAVNLTCSDALYYFLKHKITKADFEQNETAIQNFALLDDIDIFSAVKSWMIHEDKVLSFLCKSLINRNLFKITMQNEAFDEKEITDKKNALQLKYNLSEDEVNKLVITNKMTIYLYNPKENKINILYKDGSIKDFAEATDQWNVTALGQPVTKYYVCFPRLETN
jgi:HD superfamily phosphohydrolase